jgi:hypothetical protein
MARGAWEHWGGRAQVRFVGFVGDGSPG